MNDTSLLEEKTISQLKGLGVSFAPIVEEFNTDIAERIGKLDVAITENDAESAQSLLHSMKGASLTLGARKLSDGCASLEILAKRGDWERLRGGMAEISLRFEETVTALRAEFGSV